MLRFSKRMTPASKLLGGVPVAGEEEEKRIDSSKGKEKKGPPPSSKSDARIGLDPFLRGPWYITLRSLPTCSSG